MMEPRLNINAWLVVLAISALGMGLIVYLGWVLVGRLVRDWMLLLLFDGRLGLFLDR